MIRLVDGREVDSASDEWRHECEARAIANIPGLAQRREWLENLEKRRGKPAADRMRVTLKALWAEKK